MLRKFAIGFAVAAGVIASALPASAEISKPVTVAIGGRGLITYLPLTLADRLGYFKEAGLTVQINDFAGGSKSTEALVGGSADVSIGAYEHTLLLQPKGITLKAIALFNESYGAVIALKPALAKKYKSPADLKGLKMGVTTPGSSGALAITILLSKAKLPPSAVSIIGIGGGPGALSAIKSGQLDGVAQFDPVVSEAIHDGDMVPIVDTRTKAGMDYLYGGYIAASSVLTTPKFIKERPEAAKAFARAIGRAVKWLHSATPDQVAATVPKAYLGTNPALYKEAVAKVKDTFTTDGAIPPKAAENTYRVLSTFGPLKGVKGINVKETYDNSLVRSK
ncbi:MAG TPA: ABC transporter substrate-binding protein [Pseudolabrys sp.]|jgi:NitT/TauT family transport system substrate-binding protein|nr:ABC transporter substrate-binding protein [Pseudolabrys sp.]